MDISHFKILSTPGHKEALEEVFNSGELVVGKHLGLLEERLKHIFKKKHCILSNNGFSALFLSLSAMDKQDLKVLMPAASTCFAIYNAILASGNKVVFADVDEYSGNIFPESAKDIISKQHVDIIISPNYFGIPSDIEDLKSFGIPIIEDSAQSFLTNKDIGCRGDITTFSFYPSKIINGIDGGAILTDDDYWADRIRDIVYYNHQTSASSKARFNYRLPNINAAYCLASLDVVEEASVKLKETYKQYINACNAGGINFLGSNIANQVIPNRFVLSFNSKQMKENARGVFEQNSIRSLKELLNIDPDNTFYSAQKVADTSLSIPFHYDLKQEEINTIISTIRLLNKNGD
jgi:dTDP-4-amino-4,6-dideoxygalactose transaminase